MSDQITAPISAINSRRKIYANVTQHDFDLFCKRCTAEGIFMGEALSELVHQYAHGAVLKPGTKKNHRVENIDYRKEREGK